MSLETQLIEDHRRATAAARAATGSSNEALAYLQAQHGLSKS